MAKVRQTIEVCLPSLRRDARQNAEDVLSEIAKNGEVTISEISQNISVSPATVKNVRALLRNVGVLYRVGGDFGGHWMISLKDGNAENG